MQIRISNIRYVNTLPFRIGLADYSFPPAYEVTVSEDSPAECAKKLADGRSDLGIVPVAALHDIPGIHVVSDYCIASKNEVRSVMLFSEVPLQNITGIFLDYQSRTSVRLIQHLARTKWKLNCRWINATPGYEEQIQGSTAGLVIGDRALALYNRFQYKYDLATEWNALTGLPFVFAVWAASRPLPDDFLSHFNQALTTGLHQLDARIEEFQPLYPYDINEYLHNNIHYVLDNSCRKAIESFQSTL